MIFILSRAFTQCLVAFLNFLDDIRLARRCQQGWRHVVVREDVIGETVPGLMTPGHLMAHGTRQAPSQFVSCSREEPASEQRFQSNQSDLSLLPPECRCEEKGMLSATKNHLAKELFHDTSSTSHDRGHVGAPG